MIRIPLVRLALALFVVVPGAHGGEAVVEDVEATRAQDGSWRFTVTIRHADEGWEHYADAFTVETADGTILGRRTLHHPHVDEQPFTRSLSGVEIADGTQEVVVRAHDSVHGPGAAVVVTLSGP